MKKIFILLFLFFLNPLLNAQWRFGTLQLGLGASISEDGIYASEYEVNVFNISFDIYSLNEKTAEIIPGLGVALIPLNIKNMFGNSYYSIFNFQVYWDILMGFYSMLGPFVSINYAPNFDFNNYILCAGIRYIMAAHELYMLSVECCYRLFENKNYIYFGITFDVLIPVGILGFLSP